MLLESFKKIQIPQTFLRGKVVFRLKDIVFQDVLRTVLTSEEDQEVLLIVVSRLTQRTKIGEGFEIVCSVSIVLIQLVSIMIFCQVKIDQREVRGQRYLEDYLFVILGTSELGLL